MSGPENGCSSTTEVAGGASHTRTIRFMFSPTPTRHCVTHQWSSCNPLQGGLTEGGMRFFESTGQFVESISYSQKKHWACSWFTDFCSCCWGNQVHNLMWSASLCGPLQHRDYIPTRPNLLKIPKLAPKCVASWGDHGCEFPTSRPQWFLRISQLS